MPLSGMPLDLAEYPARTITNRRFLSHDLGALDRCFLPPAMTGLIDVAPIGVRRFLEDDNRGAVAPAPIATLDGVDFYLSVKGVGSAADPFSARPLDRTLAAALTTDADVRRRLEHPAVATPAGQVDRFVTGEVWLRGSPYGGQGLGHAETALRLSEQADPTSIRGFRIAPVVKVAFLPPDLAARVRSLHWYRTFRAPIVQELRLVPSNVRIYFHSRTTVGADARTVLERYGIDSDPRALAFELNFVRSGIAMMTLFARTLAAEGDRCSGLDYLDVWLDKDAVLAPNGEVFFVDLEGIEPVRVDRAGVAEKLEDQVYRSLYEFMFAYEQIDAERRRRFGDAGTRKGRLATLVERALRDDPCVRPVRSGDGLDLEIRPAGADQSLYTKFRLLDA
ncbi:MAG TPA: hypothetical protein VMG14_04405 [Thermoplasmata archaeon]|nr:hypothetical protein [Thermoplasmata archaeon]